MILVIIPALIRQLFPKETQEAVYLAPVIKPEKKLSKGSSQENSIDKMREENTISDIFSDLITASSDLLALKSDAEEKQNINKIIQKKLVFEKIITIKAPLGQLFMGYELLQSLQNAGLKFSSKGLFYYIDISNDHHEQNKILFELSPSIEPYRFNLAEIGVFSTPGLILKIIESTDEARVQQIAEMLADELGGEVEC